MIESENPVVRIIALIPCASFRSTSSNVWVIAFPPFFPVTTIRSATRSGLFFLKSRGCICAIARSRGTTFVPFTSTGSSSSSPSSRIASMILACPGYRSVLYSIVGILPS